MTQDAESKKEDIFIKKIGVVMGGCSSEREISIKSGTGALKALTEAGCNVGAIDLKTENPDEVAAFLKNSKIDIAFLALHGRFGEDGKIQKILEDIGLPYTGSDSKASYIAMDKLLTYATLEKNNIRVPRYLKFNKSSTDIERQAKAAFKGGAVVVKPSSEGSSFGISIVSDYAQLEQAIKDAFYYGDEIIIEGYIKGKELTVGILGNKLLPVVEIRPKNFFFDFKAKYQSGMTEYLVPAPIDLAIAQEVQRIAWKVHQSIGCRHLSRVDFILDEENIPWVLEINTIPGMTATSLLPKAAAAAGINFGELCLTLAKLAYERKN